MNVESTASAAEIPHAEVAARVRAEQLALVYANTSGAIAVHALTGLITVAITWTTLDRGLLLGWLAVLLALCTLRWRLNQAWSRARRGAADVPLWETRIVAATFVMGVVWGSAGIPMFVDGGGLQLGFAVFVLGGMSAGSVATLGPIRKAYLSFTLPIALCMIIGLLGRGDRDSFALAMLCVMFVGALIVTVGRFSDLVARNLELRLRNESLVDSLSSSNRQLAEANKLLRHEVEERSRAEAWADFLARHDALTGLPNRRMQHDRFQLAATQARRKHLRVAVMFIDLDRFKAVNDSLGHAAGDRLLCEIAQRLRHCLRDVDSISRQGGDEFILLLGEVADRNAVAHVAERILEILAEPIRIDDVRAEVGGSIGISLFPDHGSDFDLLVRCADTALFRAKREGRGDYRFFDPAEDGADSQASAAA